MPLGEQMTLKAFILLGNSEKYESSITLKFFSAPDPVHEAHHAPSSPLVLTENVGL